MREHSGGIGNGLRRFWDRHPLFVAALGAVAVVAAAGVHPAFGFCVWLLFAVPAWRLGGLRRAVLPVVCSGLAAAVFLARDGGRREVERAMSHAPGGTVRARILEDADGNERYWMAPARLAGGRWSGRKVWWEGGGDMPVAGAVVRSHGNFEALPVTRNPGEFDRASWLRGRGVAAVFRADRGGGAVETGPWATLGARIRHGFRERVTAGLDVDSQEARVIRAVVIGEKPADSDELVAAFRHSGTLHVFSVSGLHVTMVGGIAWWVLGWLGVPRRWAVGVLVPVIFGYAWITGFHAPAVRSAWMAAVFLGAFVLRRRPDLLNALGAVLLVGMLWDGRMLFQAGVQLSYGVVAAIALGVSWAARVFKGLAERDSYLPDQLLTGWRRGWFLLRKRAAQALGVSLAAGVGSAPLTAWHFGLLTPVSVIAGPVLVLLVFGLLSLALLGVALSPVSGAAARAVNRVNGHLANGCVGVARGFASVPGGHFNLRRESGPGLWVYDLRYGAGAACFSDGNGAAVMMDCGDARSFRHTLVPSMRRLGVEPDSVVLSHPDGGHLGGGSPVWEAFPIRQALMPVELSRSPSYQSWMADGPAAGLRLHAAAGIRSLAFPDGARLEILHAPDALALDSAADERVLLSRLHWRGWKLLFTSDSGMGAELAMLDTGCDLSADVIIAGRHRGDLALCDAFLDAVDPQAIVASNPAFPPEERLDAKTADYWKSRGIRVFDQARTGAVHLRVTGSGELAIEGFLEGSALLLKRR